MCVGLPGRLIIVDYGHHNESTVYIRSTELRVIDVNKTDLYT